MDVKIYPHHRKSCVRAGNARAALYAHVIEGERLTTMQVADRIGASHKVATNRLKRGPFPLTWSALKTVRLPNPATT